MKCFSLFTGVGGFEQGFPKDWEYIGFSEIDKYAVSVLKYHYPNVKNYGDCSKIDYGQVPNFDLLTGGSPCQDFSIAGKRAGIVGSRSGLVWEYIRCLREKQPRYFIWENVKGVMSSRGGWDFANILTAFSESGYSLWWQVLNAKDFGVPQNRERIFVCGFRDENPKEVFFEREETSRVVQGEELREQIGNTLRTNYSNGRSNETYVLARSKSHRTGRTEQDRKRKNYGEIEERIKIGEFNTLNTGEGGRSQSTQNFILRDGRDNRSSLRAGRNTELGIKGMSIRRLTPTECERLMGWPDNHTKYGIDDKGNKVEISDSQRYRQCGNGVVSNVVCAIVKELLMRRPSKS